jgi:hypothetical protein
MKHFVSRTVGSLLCVLLFAAALPGQSRPSGSKGKDLESEMPADASRLKIGDAAPDFSLKGVDGQTYTLASFTDARLLMVAFLSNHCPYSHAAETRLLLSAACE